MLAQLIVSGLAVGFCYALLALAMVIIYKTSDVLNFAQGEMAMISAFMALVFLDSYQVSFPIGLALTLLFAAALGAFLEFAFLRPAKNPTVIGMIIITLGFEMILMGIAGWKWGPDQRNLPFPIPSFETYNFAGLVVSKINFWTIIVCLILIALLFVFFQYSKLGTAMRATQQNVNAAKIMGIKVENVFSITWAMSSLIGAVAAMFFAARSVLDPNFMMEPFMRAFAAAVLGGLTSIPGVVVGGLILGIIENFFGYAWPEWKPIVAFIVIIIVITVRPSGLFAKHYIKKV